MAERTEKTYLGLDIGTSSVKALLVDADQRVVAEASPTLDVSRPHPLWSEQDPDDWVRGVEAGVAAIRAQAPEAFGRLAGIGLSGQMHGATLLDAADKPLRPAILWNDGRSFAECARTQAPRARRRDDHRQPGDAWLHRAEDAVGRGTTSRRSPRRPSACCCPRITCACASRGEAVSEMSDASGTSWLDVGKRRWDERLLEATGLTLAAMPRLVEGSEVSAYLLARRRRGLGPRGPQDPDRRGRGRQRGLGHRRRRDRGRRGLRLARHLGRDLLGDRPLRQPARAHPARLLPRAAEPLARHVGDAVGGLVARLDRRPSSAARTRSARWSRRRRASRSRRRPSPPRRCSCPISAASARRTTTPRRRECSPDLRASHGADALVFAVMEGVAFSFADGVDVLDAAGARPVRPLLVGGGRALGFLGPDDRRRDRADDRRRAGRGGRRGARRRAARHARGRRRNGRGGLHAAAGAAELRARRRQRRPARARLKRYRALYPAEKAARYPSPRLGGRRPGRASHASPQRDILRSAP